MKFGDYLKANSLQCWKSDYINYDLLKGFIKQHPDWQDEHQYEFIRLVTQEYHRITDMIDQHTLELRNRIHRDNWVDILLDIYDFSRFVQLNQTGFEKMIKKHKKYTQRSIDLVFILVFDDVSLYTSLRQSDDGEKKPASSTQLLTSKKYWLDHSHVPQVVANLCMHMLVDYHSNLSNFYMDNARMECYLDRLDGKDDSEMIKFKSYQDDACIEHAIYNTSHSGDIQYKQRNQVLNTELATVWEKSGQDFIFASNNEDLQHTILSKQLKIMLQCDYTRIRFYSPQYPSLIVTLDTNISFSKPDSHPKSFHFAVLEIKQTGTDPNQGIPLKGLETLLGKNESTILSHVPQFSKFVQGIYQMYSPLAAVPPWIDLAKERCWSPSLSLLRPSPTTSSTTTAVAQPDYTSIHISESECDSVHEDVKVEIRRTKPKRLIAYDQEGNPVYKKKRVKQDDTVLKVEPKVFFANERTFISWLQFCALLLTVALNLLNFGDLISRICGAIFLSIAVVLSLYALFRFQYRAKMLRNHQAQARYDDVYGPAVLCLLIVGALVINFWLRFHN